MGDELKQSPVFSLIEAGKPSFERTVYSGLDSAGCVINQLCWFFVQLFDEFGNQASTNWHDVTADSNNATLVNTQRLANRYKVRRLNQIYIQIELQIQLFRI